MKSPIKKTKKTYEILKSLLTEKKDIKNKKNTDSFKTNQTVNTKSHYNNTTDLNNPSHYNNIPGEIPKAKSNPSQNQYQKINLVNNVKANQPNQEKQYQTFYDATTQSANTNHYQEINKAELYLYHITEEMKKAYRNLQGGTELGKGEFGAVIKYQLQNDNAYKDVLSYLSCPISENNQTEIAIKFIRDINDPEVQISNYINQQLYNNKQYQNRILTSVAFINDYGQAVTASQVMPFKSALDYISKQQSVDILQRMILESTEAVMALNDMGILHRDIAARNFLVGQDGVKICDFGRSRVAVNGQYVDNATHADKQPIECMSANELLYQTSDASSERHQLFKAHLEMIGSTFGLTYSDIFKVDLSQLSNESLQYVNPDDHSEESAKLKISLFSGENSDVVVINHFIKQLTLALNTLNLPASQLNQVNTLLENLSNLYLSSCNENGYIDANKFSQAYSIFSKDYENARKISYSNTHEAQQEEHHQRPSLRK